MTTNFDTVKSMQLSFLKTDFDKNLDKNVVVLLLNIHGQQLWSWRDSQLTLPHFYWAGLYLLSS